MQASKWAKHPLLVTVDEMKELLQEARLFNVSQVVDLGAEEVAQEDFLASYRAYLENWSPECDLTPYRAMFSLALSITDECFEKKLFGERVLLKTKWPVIQMQPFTFLPGDPSKSLVSSKDAISWGIQFSYPAVMLDPETKTILNAFTDPKCPNRLLYKSFAKRVRKLTRSVKLGEKLFPFRRGNLCELHL